MNTMNTAHHTGWFDDSTGHNLRRFWDRTRLTDHVTGHDGSSAVDPITPVALVEQPTLEQPVTALAAVNQPAVQSSAGISVVVTRGSMSRVGKVLVGGVLSKKRCVGWTVGLCAIILVLPSCGGGGTSSSIDLVKFCTDFDNATSAIDAQFDRLDPPSQAELVAVAATVRRIASEAPAAIKGDLTFEADAFQKASTNGNLDDAAASAADDRVVAYVDSNCATGTDTAAASETSASAATTPALTEAAATVAPATTVRPPATTLPARTTVAPTTTRPATTTTAAAATTTTPPATPGCTAPTKKAFSGDLVGRWAFMIGSPDSNPDVASLMPRCNFDDGVTITEAADGTYQVTSNSPALFTTFGRTECPDLPAGTVVMTFTGTSSPYAGEYPTYDDKTCAFMRNLKVTVVQGTLDDGTPTLDFGQPGGYFVELIWLG